jgi:hypothetical protein
VPNVINANGLTIASRAELIEKFTTAYQAIYGGNIDLSPDSPDGQMMMIFIQAILDNADLIQQTNAQFDPDQAIGVILDQRVALNGIQRQGGTFTVTNITVVTSQALTLPGLDQDAVPVYTVADNAGNQWELLETQNPSGAGTFVYAFRAKNPGAIPTSPNTITVPVTIVLGVVSVNNPTTYTTLGVNEELDSQLKIRRQQSTSINAQGYFNGLLAALRNISGVTFAKIYENNTDATDGDGIPSHSIWVITAGSATLADIAQAIYIKRNAGCGMFNLGDSGSRSYAVEQADGSLFVIRWDEVVAEDLFIKFTVSSLDGVNAPDIALIRSRLPEIFTPGVFEQVNINDLATLVQQIDSNALVTLAGFSYTSGGAFTNTLTPTEKNRQFAVTADNIIILPITLVPASATVADGGTVQFSTLGGFGTLTYSMQSGTGSINASSGLYTSSGAGSDVVKVEDALGNTATAPVTVT